MATPAEEPDAARLSEALRTVASPTRLRLLWALRVPKRAAELRIPAEEDRGGLQHRRMLSRTTLLEHLGVLAAAGLVERREADKTYVVNQQRLFRVVEDFGRLARIRPVVEVDVEVTLPSRGAPPSPLPPGPRLVVVAGPREGEAFRLAGPGPWIVGRGAEADVRLDHDPHLSRAHLRLGRGGDEFTVEALPEARNPARLDFAPLPTGEPAPLRNGAILVAGSSRLVFQE